MKFGWVAERDLRRPLIVKGEERVVVEMGMVGLIWVEEVGWWLKEKSGGGGGREEGSRARRAPG